MRVQVAFNFKVVESTFFEFSQPLAPAAFQPPEAKRLEAKAPETPVLPMGSSTIAPGLSAPAA